MTMNHSSVTHNAPNGAQVEVGTITFEGHPYSALGSVVDHAQGHLTAYVTEYPDPSSVSGLAYSLTTWEGETIASLYLVRKYRGGFGRTTMYAWRAIVDGRTYHGRNAGHGMLLRMRASSTA